MMSNKVYSPGAIANYFLERSWKDEKHVSPMKLQKLVYFAYGWATVFLEKNLIDEPVEAWEFGPVCSSIYHEFKGFGKKEIPPDNLMIEVRSVDLEDEGKKIILFKKATNKIDPKDKGTLDLLDSVWQSYLKYSATELSDMTHKSDEDNPWIIARTKGNENGFIRGTDLAKSDVKKYFEKLRNEKRLC
jgi:uncharacterized phage-associated protein